MNKFSIVTPSFRNSEWLKLCVASVADQAVEHEHIIQDGGSDDGTLDWLLSDPRVSAVAEKDAGMYDALNRALRRSCGEYIAFLIATNSTCPVLSTPRAIFWISIQRWRCCSATRWRLIRPAIICGTARCCDPGNGTRPSARCPR